MSYLKTSLITGEKVVYQARYHWLLHFLKVFWLVVLAGAGVALAIYHQEVGERIERFLHEVDSDGSGTEIVQRLGEGTIATVVLWVGIGFAALRVLSYIKFLIWLRSVEYAVTTHRVVMKHGLIRRRTFEVMLHQLETASAYQGLRGRLFGYGQLALTATGGASQRWGMLAHPFEFKKQIEATLMKSQKKDPGEGAPARATAVDGPGTFRVVGVNRESGEDAEMTIEAGSEANAKVKAELAGLVVTAVHRAKAPGDKKKA